MGYTQFSLPHVSAQVSLYSTHFSAKLFHLNLITKEKKANCLVKEIDSESKQNDKSDSQDDIFLISSSHISFKNSNTVRLLWFEITQFS